MSEVRQGLDLWVDRLVNENMPIFNRTVQYVAGVAASENSSLSEVAWTILKDPSLTVQVIKLANSAYYNAYSTRISTVSRAVMRLGLNTIKEICLSIGLVETLLSGLHKNKLELEVARAFHSAVQARRFAVLRKLPDSEEIFIAALLSRIGKIAFWCFAGQTGAALEKAMPDSESEDEAEVKMLGFRLERLTLRLNREWKLSALLESALRDPSGSDPRIRCIKLACAVAQRAEQGWDCSAIKKTTREAADFLNLPEKKTIETMYESAREAAEITASFGGQKSSLLIPQPVINKLPPTLKSSIKAPSGATGQHIEIRKEYPKPDPCLQMGSLRDLSTAVMSKKADLNMVLTIILEGIYRGIGMDMVFFALLTKDRKFFEGRYALGWIGNVRIENVRIRSISDSPNIFGYMIKDRNPIWVTAKPDKIIKRLLTDEITVIGGGGPFFAMPVAIKGTVIGVIYSDRNQSRRELDEESFENFAFFGRQTNASLDSLAGL